MEEQLQQALIWHEGAFYASVIIMGAVSGLCRTLRDPDYNSISNLLGIVGCSGFLAFFIVAFLCRGGGVFGGNLFFYLGVAAFVGLLGKEQDVILKVFLRWLVYTTKNMFKVPPDE